MINEWEEFCAYTGTVSYTASKKSDTTWLGRFTFATILEFEGMARILTILARGYLFHDKNGTVISGDSHDRIDYARRALCAWCSVPEDGKRAPGKEWQLQTDFSELHTEFPELVDADGIGWFLRHVLRTADFMLTHPENVRSTSLKYAEVIQSKFAAAWRSKVLQYPNLWQGLLDALETEQRERATRKARKIRPCPACGKPLEVMSIADNQHSPGGFDVIAHCQNCLADYEWFCDKNGGTSDMKQYFFG